MSLTLHGLHVAAAPSEGPASGIAGSEKEGGVSSPPGNTGDVLTSPLQVRHDWLNCTFPAGARDEVRALVDRYLGPSELRDRGANTYRESCGWDSKALLAWTEDRVECWLSMNGDSCDLILPELKLQFVQELRALGANCTRLDVAVDVPLSWVAMDQVHAAALSDQVVGFQRYDASRPISNMATGELDADQARFGRRGKDGSGRFVRVYDKNLESAGKIKSIRFEVELSGDLSRMYFLLLSNQADLVEFNKLLSSIVPACIDFADKSGAHGHRDRFKRLPWWSRIVASVANIARVTVERVPPSLERSVQWACRSWPSLLGRLDRRARVEGMSSWELVQGFVRELLIKGRQMYRPIGRDNDFETCSLFKNEQEFALNRT